MSATCTYPAWVSSRAIRRPFQSAAFAFLALVASSTGASAQESSRNDAPSAVRRWDVSAGVGARFFDGAGVGTHFVDAAGVGDSYSNWSGAWQPRVQAGYYLTPHLKLEVTASPPSTYAFYDSAQVPVPEWSAPVYVFTEHRSRVASVAPVATYQFLENAFAHPFVSAGLELGFVHERIARMEQTRRTGGVSYTVPATHATRDAVTVWPLVAGGFKTYFNERVFVRPESSLAFRRPGVTQFSLRLDVGFDF